VPLRPLYTRRRGVTGAVGLCVRWHELGGGRGGEEAPDGELWSVDARVGASARLGCDGGSEASRWRRRGLARTGPG
jgi:hypothetical protein